MATVLPFAVASFPANAMPIGGANGASAVPTVTLVRDGCGFGFHRGPLGYCRPNRGYAVAPGAVVVGAPLAAAAAAAAVVGAAGPCPLGYHLGPYGHACFPN